MAYKKETMLKLSENQVEEIIYSSPWLIDERYSIPNIKGSRGQKGRQINIGKDKSRFLDLLFKDTRDNRPVIIELKKGKIIRENIAQILEYRALLLSIGEEQKEIWKAEFDENFYVSKLMLIGTSADEETIISANLAGIKLRFFGQSSSLELEFESFKDLKAKISEWEVIRDSGNRTLIDRNYWVASIVEKVNSIIQNVGEDLTTIPRNPVLTRRNKAYIEYSFPYLNIPIIYKGIQILGIYEYFDAATPFSDKHIYIDFPYLFEYEIEDEISQKAFNDAKSIKLKGIEVFEDPNNDDLPCFRLEREILENDDKFEKALSNLIKKSIQIFNETYED